MTEDRNVSELAEADEDRDPTPLPSHIAPSASDDAEPAGAVVSAEKSGLAQDEIERLTADIVEALKTVYDPEIPVDIYELGLIYKVDIDDGRHVHIDMTLTAPGCPVAGEMPVWVEDAVNTVPGVSGATANMVFDPPWDMSRMSDEARVALNMW